MVQDVPSDWAQVEAQTQPCIDFLQTGHCPAGFACHCAHNAAQLRPRPCPTASLRFLLQHAGWQLPAPEAQSTGVFGLLLPHPAGHMPEACHAAAAINAALQATHQQQQELVRQAAAAAQAAEAAAAAPAKHRASPPQPGAHGEQQLAPQVLLPPQPPFQQGTQEEGQPAGPNSSAVPGGKREATIGEVGGGPAKRQCSDAAAAVAEAGEGSPMAGAAGKQDGLPHKLQQDMTDSAHEACPPAATVQPPAGDGCQVQSAAARAEQQPPGGQANAQLAAKAAALQAQVAALEHDLQQKDTACMELQDRWVQTGSSGAAHAI